MYLATKPKSLVTCFISLISCCTQYLVQGMWILQVDTDISNHRDCWQISVAEIIFSYSGPKLFGTNTIPLKLKRAILNVSEVAAE